MFKIRIIPVTESQITAGFAPKYTLQVRMFDGHLAIRQTPELIEELNKCLENTPLALSGNELLPFEEKL